MRNGLSVEDGKMQEEVITDDKQHGRTTTIHETNGEIQVNPIFDGSNAAMSTCISVSNNPS